MIGTTLGHYRIVEKIGEGGMGVVSKDIMTIPEDEIPKNVVLYTIVGGKVMYGRRQTP